MKKVYTTCTISDVIIVVLLIFGIVMNVVYLINKTVLSTCETHNNNNHLLDLRSDPIRCVFVINYNSISITSN